MKTYRDFEAFYEDRDGLQSNRKGIASVETGFHILTTLVGLGDQSSLKLITQASGLDTSQVHRYLSSLVNSGLVRQNSSTGLYSLGPQALTLGLAALSRLDPLTIVSEMVEKLVSHGSYTALVSIWGPNGPVIVRWHSGNQPIYTTLSVGSVMPLTRSATGRVFLSFLKGEYIADKLVEEGWQPSLSDNEELVVISDSIRETGISVVDGTVIPGLRACAMPVFGYQDSVPCVVTLISSKSVPKARDKKMHKDLAFLCKNLTEQLGGTWPFHCEKQNKGSF